MSYRDLREFIQQLEASHELKRTQVPVDPYLEVTEICDRVLRKQGPALLFEQPSSAKTALLANLFGTVNRVTTAMGCSSLKEMREIGQFLAFLRSPTPPENFKDAWEKFRSLKPVLDMRPMTVRRAQCQDIVIPKDQVDLSILPIQTCWPEDVAPLITWSLTVTKGPRQQRTNLGVYRQQLIAKNRLIMRWLKHRGGALDYQAWCQQYPDKPFPIAVVLGVDPATLLSAVTPIPDTLSEYAFAGLLRGHRTELVNCLTHDLQVPAASEFVLEGFIYPGDTAQEGPFGDHTGYYNEVESFPVFTIETITHRDQPIYLSTYTGRPPDEPAVLGVALNELFVPLLQKQFPEIIDFYLPPEGCSYRMAVVSIRKQYPGHARSIMMGIWSFLRQFMYTKFIIVTDDDVDVRTWTDVIWAISTRVDPARDTVIIEHTPIDSLDFASPVSGLGAKMGIDATNKSSPETQRVWGRPIIQSEQVKQRIDSLWSTLGL